MSVGRMTEFVYPEECGRIVGVAAHDAKKGEMLDVGLNAD